MGPKVIAMQNASSSLTDDEILVEDPEDIGQVVPAHERSDRFLEVAVEQQLLSDAQVQLIVQHARRHDQQPSDAALSLSMLQMHEVDAISLLMEPESLTPSYELTDLIGCGAGGIVFRARQRNLDRDVAIKTINVRAANASPTAEARIEREAHAIAKLHHPHIVTAYDSGFHNNRFFIAMELVKGENLADLIQREGPLPEMIAWRIARQIASALDHANRSGVIHRDVKPGNVLLATPPEGIDWPEGVPLVKVADFGLALELHSARDQITVSGATLGTPAYVAPEQLLDTRVDARADIYALGATVFQMLTGFPPSREYSPMKILMQKTIGDDRWRNELTGTVSDASRRLFLDMTHSEIDDRVSSHQELLSRIDEILNGDANDTLPVVRSTGLLSQSSTLDAAATSTLDEVRPVSRRRGRRWLLSTAIVVMTLIGVGAFSVMHASLSREPEQEQQEFWEPSEVPTPLFDGRSVPRDLQATGTWIPQLTEEGSLLKGLAGARLSIPLTHDDSTNVRVRLRVGMEDGEQAEIVLGSSRSEASQAEIKVDRETVSFRSGNDAPVETHLDVDSATGSRTVFHRVEIVAQPEKLFVWVNGQLIGQADRAEASYVELRCAGIGAKVADMDVVALARKDAGGA